MPAPARTLVVWPHILGEDVYLVAVTDGGLSYELARIDDGVWLTMHSINGPIAGPEPSAGGQVFFGSGGKLMTLDGDRTRASGDDTPVTCLGHQGTLAYACTPTGLHALDDDGLGEELFDFDNLMDPRLVPAAIAPECDMQWLRFQLDLQRLASAADDAGVVEDAGRDPPDAGDRVDAGMRADAGKKRARRSDDGCGCHLDHARGDHASATAWPVLTLLALRLRRRSSRRARG